MRPEILAFWDNNSFLNAGETKGGEREQRGEGVWGGRGRRGWGRERERERERERDHLASALLLADVNL